MLNLESNFVINTEFNLTFNMIFNTSLNIIHSTNNVLPDKTFNKKVYVFLHYFFNILSIHRLLLFIQQLILSQKQYLYFHDTRLITYSILYLIQHLISFSSSINILLQLKIQYFLQLNMSFFAYDDNISKI